jgi:hypothetical protein
VASRQALGMTGIEPPQPALRNILLDGVRRLAVDLGGKRQAVWLQMFAVVVALIPSAEYGDFEDVIALNRSPRRPIPPSGRMVPGRAPPVCSHRHQAVDHRIHSLRGPSLPGPATSQILGAACASLPLLLGLFLAADPHGTFKAMVELTSP